LKKTRKVEEVSEKSSRKRAEGSRLRANGRDVKQVYQYCTWQQRNEDASFVTPV